MCASLCAGFARTTALRYSAASSAFPSARRSLASVQVRRGVSRRALHDLLELGLGLGDLLPGEEGQGELVADLDAPGVLSEGLAQLLDPGCQGLIVRLLSGHLGQLDLRLVEVGFEPECFLVRFPRCNPVASRGVRPGELEVVHGHLRVDRVHLLELLDRFGGVALAHVGGAEEHPRRDGVRVGRHHRPERGDRVVIPPGLHVQVS